MRFDQLNLDASRGLPDHFNYPEDFCAQFDQQVLITSGKDAVKLGDSNPKVWMAEISVKLPPALTQALEDCIGPTID
jgi:tetraacyldisaccharide 4'-kinase